MFKLMKKDILKYIGRESQLFGTKEYSFMGGKAEGVKAIDVKNGSGLEFTVLPGRGMDISQLSFQSINFSFLSCVGVANPQYFSEYGRGFLRNYHAGFLTTCGLRQVGPPTNDEGEELGLHGRLSNIPAEEVYAGTEWTEEGAVIKVKGKVREGMFFGENLVLDREITCKVGENKIFINDTVENRGFSRQPLMIMYHFNMGYPLLDSCSYLMATSKSVTAANSAGEKGIKDWMKFQEPTADYEEQLFYHEDIYEKEDVKSYIAIINEKIAKGIVFKFNKNQLNNIVQWKQAGEGEYVTGLLPANCRNEGRKIGKEQGYVQYINPGETKNFNLEIIILENEESITQFTTELPPVK